MFICNKSISQGTVNITMSPTVLNSGLYEEVQHGRGGSITQRSLLLMYLVAERGNINPLFQQGCFLRGTLLQKTHDPHLPVLEYVKVSNSRR